MRNKKSKRRKSRPKYMLTQITTTSSAATGWPLIYQTRREPQELALHLENEPYLQRFRRYLEDNDDILDFMLGDDPNPDFNVRALAEKVRQLCAASSRTMLRQDPRPGAWLDERSMVGQQSNIRTEAKRLRAYELFNKLRMPVSPCLQACLSSWTGQYDDFHRSAIPGEHEQ